MGLNGIPAGLNGIPVTLRRLNDADRPEECHVYFASVRKHPALAGKIKALRSAERKEQKAMATAFRRARELDALPIGDGAAVEAAEAAVIDAQTGYDTAADARLSAVAEFYMAGMVGAGYSAETAEEYLPLFERDKYGDLIASVIAGCGHVDFFAVSSDSTGMGSRT